MRKKKVTMLDIATAVGVSQPTVSVILNGSDNVKVSEETRAKVLHKAHELGYQQKANVRHSSDHKRIALLVNSVNMHDPFINAISAAKVRAWESDVVLVVYDYEDNEGLKKAMLKDIANGGYLSLIFAANTPTAVSDAPQLGIPLVYLNCINESAASQCPTILAADFLGGYHAAMHLIDAGYRALAMIGGELWADSSMQRVKGFRQALINNDIPARDEWIVAGNWSVKQTYIETLQLLQQTPRPDAIFCASDLMALGCYQAIAARRLNIPEDVAVIGYDNQLLASELTPALSSIDLPYDEMGRKAVAFACGECESEVSLIKVEGELFPRQST